MKIKKSSWHSKVRNFGKDWKYRNDSLCFYFWSVVLKLMLSAAAITWICFVAYMWFTEPDWIANTILLVGILLAISLPPITVLFFRRWTGKPCLYPIFKPGRVIDTMDSFWYVVIGFLKAKKRKICPMIEYI